MELQNATKHLVGDPESSPSYDMTVQDYMAAKLQVVEKNSERLKLELEIAKVQVEDRKNERKHKLEMEKLKNERLKLELEIAKVQVENEQHEREVKLRVSFNVT